MTQPTSRAGHSLQVAWKLHTQTQASSTKMSAFRIASSAITLADTQGLEAVTMRAAASQVGLATMGIYRHVASRDELLLAMFEIAMGEPPHLSTKDAWQHTLRSWSQALLDSYQKHPWLIDMPITGMPATPNHMLWVERALDALAPTNLPPQRQLDCALLIDGRARQFARIARESKGTSETPNIPELLRLAEDHTPRLVAAVRQGALQSKQGPSYMAGIDIIIHGLEKELEIEPR